MQILLVYRENELGDAWRTHFANETDVQIIQDDITSLTCDAVVSPANSFGFMDGGLDHALSDRLGWHLQKTLQQEIKELPEGELLVGKSMVIPTGDKKIPWLIAAPTMRVPMSFNIATSINAYFAMKAILIAATNHAEINSVAIPGLCTGVGRMMPQTSAIQMRAAYNEIILGHHLSFADFGDAQKQQIELNPDGLIWDY